MMVKVCGITNLEDALASTEGGATALGFNFYPKSPRHLTVEQAESILTRLPAGPWKVGVFVNERPQRVQSIAGRLGLDVVQLHGDETMADLPSGLRVWKALRVDENFDFDWAKAFPVEAFLLDAPAPASYGGTGRTWGWDRLRTLKATGTAAQAKIILAGGLDAGNVAAAIEAAHPWGVDACSRLESSPGRKDHAKLAAFLRAARTAGEAGESKNE